LAKENRFDYLLIESTGISEPLPVAQTFTFIDENQGVNLSKFAKLDTLVTVVDAYNFYQDFGSSDTVWDREMTDDKHDRRAIVNLLTDQIEFANIILLNKTDLVNKHEINVLKGILHKLNPSAKILESSFGKIPLHEILHTNLFDLEEAEQGAGWKKELEKVHTPETEEYGISSFVYRTKKPFHPMRFWKYLTENFPASVIRSKGLFWLASRPDEALNWSQAGGSLRADKAGVWWVSMPMKNRIQYSAFLENQIEIEERWDKKFGDRMNELVFIGQEMDKDLIIKELYECLCSENEIEDMFSGEYFSDPFPV
jgi:G3E family GTPase